MGNGSDQVMWTGWYLGDRGYSRRKEIIVGKQGNPAYEITCVMEDWWVFMSTIDVGG